MQQRSRCRLQLLGGPAASRSGDEGGRCFVNGTQLGMRRPVVTCHAQGMQGCSRLRTTMGVLHLGFATARHQQLLQSGSSSSHLPAGEGQCSIHPEYIEVQP